MSDAKKRAKSKIESTWEDIAANYTVGWTGPIQVVEMLLPFISRSLSNIRDKVSPNLPILLYQTRESPPKKMSVAIPYMGHGNNPYNCRLISTNALTAAEIELLNDFAQALWFLIGNGVLPRPEKGDALQNKLIEWTDRKLVGL